MKLKDIQLDETAAAGVTSVASIGKVEFSASSDRIKLYRRNSSNCTQCVAKIKRKKGEGWRFSPTNSWNSQKLPHFGHLNNIKSDKNGMKTISNNLPDMLKKWGVKYDSLVKAELKKKIGT